MGTGTPDNGQTIKVYVLGLPPVALETEPKISFGDWPACSETSDLNVNGDTDPCEILIYQSQHQARWQRQWQDHQAPSFPTP